MRLTLCSCKCSVVGPLLDCIAGLTGLETLCLASSTFVALPDRISCLIGLRSLNLEHCRELTTLPPAMCAMPALEIISLQHCLCLARLPPAFGSLPRLRELNLKETKNFEDYCRYKPGPRRIVGSNNASEGCPLDGLLIPSTVPVSPLTPHVER